MNVQGDSAGDLRVPACLEFQGIGGPGSPPPSPIPLIKSETLLLTKALSNGMGKHGRAQTVENTGPQNHNIPGCWKPSRLMVKDMDSGAESQLRHELAA